MRTLLRFTVDTNVGNTTIKSGKLPAVLKEIMDMIKPEAVYFYPENGHRAGIMIFDLKDASDIPVIAEPLFIHFNARVEMVPVMNVEDMQKGVKQAVKAQFETAQ